jgi:hypothetical protein
MSAPKTEPSKTALEKELATVKAERDQLRQQLDAVNRKVNALSEAWRLLSKNLG